MSVGKITGGVGKKPNSPQFYPQGYAFPKEVGEALVVELLRTAGSRSPGGAPVYSSGGQVAVGSARGVSAGATKYADLAAKVVSGIDGLAYSKEVVAMYPGGRAGLTNEISDAFFQVLSGDTGGGMDRLSQVQSGFEQAAELVSKQKQNDLQSQSNYAMSMADKMARELPYGESWFLETAEANMKARYGTGASMLKREWDVLEEAERKRLRDLAYNAEIAMDTYTTKARELQGLADSFGPALSKLVTTLFNGVTGEVDRIFKEVAADKAAKQAVVAAKYCKDQTDATSNYIRLSNEFNSAVKSALDDFVATNAAFWSKIGV